MIKEIYWGYRNKICNKLFGVVHLPAQGKKKGDVLISYIVEPFTLAPWEQLSNYHTNNWECREIARLFSQKGYACDIVSSRNKNFKPKKSYVVCIDTDDNLEKFTKYLPRNCQKVFHALMSHWEDYNAAEKRRLNDLEKRRGIRLSPHRQLEPSKNAEYADFITAFGNKTILDTFNKCGKSVYYIPISVVKQFDFPEQKDFGEARKTYAWMGGGGAVLKGLDLTLEAFRQMPEFDLHVCGPVSAEKDFVQAFKEELEKTPNIHVRGRMEVTSQEYTDILNKCAAVVYPTAAEGSSGTIVLAMHAGVIPIISPETGIWERSGYIPLINPTVQSIIKTVRDFSKMPENEIRALSKKIWDYAREQNTRETYSAAYRNIIENVLKL